MTKKIKK